MGILVTSLKAVRMKTAKTCLIPLILIDAPTLWDATAYETQIASAA
jgi:hypothetical protein